MISKASKTTLEDKLVIEPWNDKAEFRDHYEGNNGDSPVITHVVIALGTEQGVKHEWHIPCNEADLKEVMENNKLYPWWIVVSFTFQDYLNSRNGIVVIPNP